MFIHIPKTGGSTLHSVINRNYRSRSLLNVKNDREAEKIAELNVNNLKKIQVVKGHMAFGHHKHFPNPKDFTYITMLRDPVKRIISNYYFILSRPQHYLHHELSSNNYSLKDYVQSGIVNNTENAQVRLLGNCIYVPHGKIDRTMLEQAKKNIKTHFYLASVNQFFDETILFLKEEFQWKFSFYVRQNVTGHGVKPSDLDQDTLATIKAYNSLDMELYDLVKEDFKSRIESKGSDFERRLKRYRKRNEYLEKMAKLKRKVFY